MSLLTLPTSTILATSTVVGVGHAQAADELDRQLERAPCSAVISGPPPWTTIGFSPTYLSSTTSRANSSRSAGSFIAAPPYLMTTVLPWNSRMYGSASSSVPTSRMPLTSCTPR